ncbi:MAG: DUF4157 domain-containing protein [Burkholderiales bacterium]
MQQAMNVVLNFVMDVLLLPLVLCVMLWARRRETTILHWGKSLNEDQLALAHAIGVASPERVRVMPVNVVPTLLPLTLQRAAEHLGGLPHIAGMTLGYGIVLRRDVCSDRRLLAHELAHVAQYERLGRFHGFLRRYVRECVWPGYPRGPLEFEARRAEAVIAAPVRVATQVTGECDTVRGYQSR